MNRIVILLLAVCVAAGDLRTSQTCGAIEWTADDANQLVSGPAQPNPIQLANRNEFCTMSEALATTHAATLQPSLPDHPGSHSLIASVAQARARSCPARLCVLSVKLQV
jgi:hypothetical protein